MQFAPPGDGLGNERGGGDACRGPSAPPLGPSPAPPAQPRRKAKRLGDDVVYYEDEVVGQGSFGTVFRGHCKSDGKDVAVKLFRELPPSYSTALLADLAGAAHEEGAVGERSKPPAWPPEILLLTQLRRLRCPNILYLYSSYMRRRHRGGGSAHGADEAEYASLYRRSRREFVLVTEMCAGGDLLSLLRRVKFSESAARSLTYQLCNALLVLRRQHILHRDIKPANLLLSSADPETAVLKVADLGLAKQYRPRTAAAPTTDPQHPPSQQQEHQQPYQLPQPQQPQSNAASSPLGGGQPLPEEEMWDADSPELGAMFMSVVGTPMYKSPERIRGEPYSYKADVYSAGMVLFELMTGCYVRASSPEQLLEAVPRAIQRCVEKQTRGGGPVPLWLSLVQGMTHSSPRARLSVEEVLAHPWFHPAHGPPLPPLTVPLEEVAGGGAGDRLAPPAPLSTPPLPRRAPAPSAPPPPDPDTSTDESDGRRRRVSAPSPPSTNSSLPRPATATSPRVGPAPPPPHPHPQPQPQPALPVGMSPSPPFTSQLRWWSCLAVSSLPPGPTRTSQEEAGAPSQGGVLLPDACGPHVATHAVRAYVETVLCYLVEEAAPPLPTLAVLALLAKLLDAGYALFRQEVDLYGGLLLPPPADAPASGATVEPQELSREYGVLQSVWLALSARVRAETARQRARLPPVEQAAAGGPGAGPASVSDRATLRCPPAEAVLFRTALDRIARATRGSGAGEDPSALLEGALALLRVLHQQVVLSEFEVGLRGKAAPASSSPATATPATPMSTAVRFGEWAAAGSEGGSPQLRHVRSSPAGGSPHCPDSSSMGLWPSAQRYTRRKSSLLSDDEVAPLTSPIQLLTQGSPASVEGPGDAGGGGRVYLLHAPVLQLLHERAHPKGHPAVAGVMAMLQTYLADLPLRELESGGEGVCVEAL